MAFGLDRQPFDSSVIAGQRLVVHRAWRRGASRSGKQSFELCARLTWSFGCTGALPPRPSPASSLARPADLVDVHVGLRASARLPHHERKLRVMAAGEDLVGRLFNQAGDGAGSSPLRA